MRSPYRDKTLPELRVEAGEILEATRAFFGGFSTAQLNWRPSPAGWSMAQCLDHLLASHRGYLRLFERVLAGDKRPATFWERLPWLPRFWGKFLIDAVSPQAPRKAKAPKKLQPATSELDAGILDRFLEQQRSAIGYFERLEAFPGDLDRVIFTSPVARFITYSVMNACRVIVAHEQRHLLQARRVAEAPGFPAG